MGAGWLVSRSDCIVFYIPVRHFSSNTGSMTSKYGIKRMQRRVDFQASIIH
jgi:hypothetical protein